MPESRPVRLSELGRLLGLGALLLIMVVLVIGGLGSVHRSWDSLRSAPQRSADATDAARYSCLEHEMRSRIPAGSTIYDDGADVLDYQRIAEELTPGYRFTTSPRSGAFRVRFVTVGPCEGTGVRVERIA